jgi:tetratricopeptide (TPR) repeat protein
LTLQAPPINFNQRTFLTVSSHTSFPLYRLLFPHGTFVLALLLAPCALPAQLKSPAVSVSTKQQDHPDELAQRTAALQAARNSGKPESVSAASRLTIASGLREVAQLRFFEDAFPQSVELYRQSLELEDTPAIHVDLAVALIRDGKPADALAETAKALFSAPNDVRAWRAQASAYASVGEYRNAAQSLAHALTIEGDTETAYSLATCFLHLRQKDKAALVFEDILKNNGEKPSLHVLFGRAYRDAEYNDDAVKEFQRAIALDPKTPHAHYFIGLIGLLRNEWVPTPEVRKYMQQEQQLHPDDYLSNYMLGVFASQDKSYDESDRLLGNALRSDASQPEPYIYLGLNAGNRGDKPKAEEYLRKAIVLTGNDDARSNYQIRKAYIALGRILVQTDRRDEGVAMLEHAKKLQQASLVETQQSLSKFSSERGMISGAVLLEQKAPDTLKATLNSGHVDATAAVDLTSMTNTPVTEKQKQAMVEREKQLRTVLGASYNDWGAAEAIQKHYDHALENFLQAEKWNPDQPGLSRNLGVAAARVGKYDDAIRGLSKAIASNSQDNAARAMLGVAYFMTGNYAESAQTIAPLDSVAIQDPRLAYTWAAALQKSGQLSESASVLQRLPRESLPPDMLLLIGQVWGDDGHYDEAVQTFHRALELDPKLSKAHYDAGLAYLKSDRPAEASKEFEAELALSPEDLQAKYNLAFTLLQQSQRERAVTLLEEVASKNPSHAEAQYQLGKILLDEGHVPEAVTHLEKAAQSAPEKDYIHYQLQSAYRKASRPQDAERELALYKQLKTRNQQRDPNPPVQ